MEIQYIGMACALGTFQPSDPLSARVTQRCLPLEPRKKCYANGKPAPFMMVAFSGAPLTQTIYGFLLMNFIRSAFAAGTASATLSMFVRDLCRSCHRIVCIVPRESCCCSVRCAWRNGKRYCKLFYRDWYCRNSCAVHALYLAFCCCNNGERAWNVRENENRQSANLIVLHRNLSVFWAN